MVATTQSKHHVAESDTCSSNDELSQAESDDELAPRGDKDELVSSDDDSKTHLVERPRSHTLENEFHPPSVVLPLSKIIFPPESQFATLQQSDLFSASDSLNEDKPTPLTMDAMSESETDSVTGSVNKLRPTNSGASYEIIIFFWTDLSGEESDVERKTTGKNCCVVKRFESSGTSCVLSQQKAHSTASSCIRSVSQKDASSGRSKVSLASVSEARAVSYFKLCTFWTERQGFVDLKTGSVALSTRNCSTSTKTSRYGLLLFAWALIAKPTR